MKKIIFILLVIGLLASNMILPRDDGHGFPVYTIIYQFINLGIVILILTFLLKSKIAHFYITKHKNFHEFLNKAETAKKKLEMHHQELTEKIKVLEDTKKETIQKAHSEADELKRRTLEEADKLSSKFEHDAKITLELEVEKAKEDLRGFLLTESLNVAKTSLQEKITEDDLSRLQRNFVGKIKVVHQ